MWYPSSCSPMLKKQDFLNMFVRLYWWYWIFCPWILGMMVLKTVLPKELLSMSISLDQVCLPFTMLEQWPAEEGKRWFSRVQITLHNALHDLAPIVQFKKREKHPWRSVTFRKVAGCNLVPFVQFKKREKHPWRSVTPSEVIGCNLVPFVQFKKREKCIFHVF